MRIPFFRWMASLSLLLMVGGCSLFAGGSGKKASSPENAEPAGEPVKDEVPNVDKCYTNTQVCPLEEPLQPGLGCFCPGADGKNEPGSAGG